MNKKLAVFFVCLFIICVFYAIAAACDCGPSTPCWSVSGTYPNCNYTWRCGSGRCCDGKKCYNPDTESCCHYYKGYGSQLCANGKTCCGSSKCCDLVCETCVAGSCVSLCSGGGDCCNGTCCDAAECKTCVGGECKVCGGDTNKTCCEGNCCDKVWTKETINSSIEPCSDCQYNFGEPLCDGTTTELESYERCLNVGIGQGEHCECTNTWQSVGYTYNCQIHYDVGKMGWCLLQGAWCAAECYLFMDPVGCANCLAGIEECDLLGCDFVERCEKNPYSYVTTEKAVFSSFGC